VTVAHLNRLYADLAEHGRRDGRGGLKPKSVRHVHVLLHKALSDAVRWGLVARNVADAADPPRVPRQERGACRPRSSAPSWQPPARIAWPRCGCCSPPSACVAVSCSGCPGGRSIWKRRRAGSPSSRPSWSSTSGPL
jgi:hypothetical protein